MVRRCRNVGSGPLRESGLSVHFFPDMAAKSEKALPFTGFPSKMGSKPAAPMLSSNSMSSSPQTPSPSPDLGAKKDDALVTSDGQEIVSLPEGVSIHPLATHVDERGSLTELFDPRWGLFEKPLVSSTAVTIRPGKIKGWAYHAEMEDRFCLFAGDAAFVFYDDREESSTRGMTAKVVLSEYRRSIINVPPGIWHAVQNVGTKDVLIINFPTIPYQYEDPDKFRLPVDTDRIPYQFDHPSGF